jgi:uncharacterized protein YjbJ (UPF0337 family)
MYIFLPSVSQARNIHPTFHRLPILPTSYAATDIPQEQAAKVVQDKLPNSTAEAKGQASEVAGQASGKASELAGQAQGKASEVSGKTSGKASELAGKAEGKAQEVKGEAKAKTY